MVYEDTATQESCVHIFGPNNCRQERSVSLKLSMLSKLEPDLYLGIVFVSKMGYKMTAVSSFLQVSTWRISDGCSSSPPAVTGYQSAVQPGQRRYSPPPLSTLFPPPLAGHISFAPQNWYSKYWYSIYVHIDMNAHTRYPANHYPVHPETGEPLAMKIPGFWVK